MKEKFFLFERNSIAKTDNLKELNLMIEDGWEVIKTVLVSSQASTYSCALIPLWKYKE